MNSYKSPEPNGMNLDLAQLEPEPSNRTGGNDFQVLVIPKYDTPKYFLKPFCASKNLP